MLNFRIAPKSQILMRCNKEKFLFTFGPINTEKWMSTLTQHRQWGWWGMCYVV